MVPGTGLVMFIVGGVGAAVSFVAFTTSQKVGHQLTLTDLRPAAPWEGLPFPIFFYNKPEVLADLRRK